MGKHIYNINLIEKEATLYVDLFVWVVSVCRYGDRVCIICARDLTDRWNRSGWTKIFEKNNINLGNFILFLFSAYSLNR
jgi:hypothetical protein